MKGPFWIRIGLCSIRFDDKCVVFCFCFFTQYTPPDYLPKVYEDLPMSPTHREAVINAFVYVHQTLHQANERLAKRGGRVMAITPRHYLDFINHYVSTIYDSEMFKTMERRGAQWWEHSPPTTVARVQIPALTPFVGWVCCWLVLLLWEVFLRVLRFSPLLKNNTSKFQFDLERTDTFKRVLKIFLVLHEWTNYNTIEKKVMRYLFSVVMIRKQVKTSGIICLVIVQQSHLPVGILHHLLVTRKIDTFHNVVISSSTVQIHSFLRIRIHFSLNKSGKHFYVEINITVIKLITTLKCIFW